MAYASLLSLTQTLEQILHHPDDQCQVLHQQEEQIGRSLLEKVRFFLSFLEDHSQKNSETIRCLEGRIRVAAYEAEDIIESQIDTSDQIVSDSRNHCERCVEFRRYNLAKKYENLQKVIQELDSISEQVVNMKDRNDVEILPPRNPFPAGSSKFGSSNKSDMVGFDDDLMQVKHQLTGPPSKLKIISIVGMGGIGKTMFARNVYDDPLIKYHFDTRAWTTISQEYNVQKMLTDLLDSTSNIENLDEQIYKCRKGKRYLIVLDDMWDTKAWDEVQRLFPDDSNGSRIILTTRIADVAVYAGSSSAIHHLSCLNPEKSWNLLHQTVFGKECCPCELEEIGKEIAKNCKGLPLALVVIGGLLYKGKRTHDYWMYVKQNVNSAVIDTDDQFMEILLLSYNHLPHHLRACFLYMAVFPEDYKIRKSELTKLWVAEGFIKPDRYKSLEAVAEKYVEDLLDRNMILVHKRSYTGKINFCSIHDLMRDLCVRKAQEENFLHLYDRRVKNFPEGTYNQRRVSIHSHIYGHHLEGIYGSHVRSLLYHCLDIFNEDSSFTTSFLLLRVLQAFSISFYEFPVEIVELVNLRFIVLKCMRTCELPASISNLFNLQTLIIYSRGIVKLPSDIWKMPRLRHIWTQNDAELCCPSAAGNGEKFALLENLQTLKGIVNFKFTKKVLQMMPNLKKLKIRFHHSCAELSSFCIDKFIHLHQLEDLNCFFTDKFDGNYPLLENFHLPPTLKKLTLRGCRLSSKSMAIIGSLQNLEVLNLKTFTYDGSVWEPTEENFLQLKVLLLEETDLEYLKADETNFPSLQHLTFRYCEQLEEIPSAIGNIPTLQVIKLCKCSISAVKSVKLIQEEQQDLENDNLQIIIYDSPMDGVLELGYHQNKMELSLLMEKVFWIYGSLETFGQSRNGTSDEED